MLTKKDHISYLRHCKICGNTNLKKVIKLNEQYISATFIKSNEKSDLKNIKTLADTCNSGYFKLGIYRHRTIGYWNSDWESQPDQTVYYDSIVFRKPKKEERIKNK